MVYWHGNAGRGRGLGRLGLSLVAVSVMVLGFDVGHVNLHNEAVMDTDVNGTLLIQASGDVNITSSGRIHVNGLDVSAGLARWQRWEEYINARPQMFWNEVSPHSVTSSMNYPLNAALADLDADGDLDVLGTSLNSGRLDWFRNDGSGRFDGPRLVHQMNGMSAVASADLDDDGFPDVLAASRTQGAFLWFRNLGNGGFANASVVTDGMNYPNALATADLDLDGRLDAMVASYGDGKLSWFPNAVAPNGTVAFGAQRIIDHVAYPLSIAAADLDNDGKPDILAPARDAHLVAWYRNLGNGSFSAQRLVCSNCSRPLAAFPADVDDDGWIDVVVSSVSAVTWYRNLGAAGFAPGVVLKANVNNAYSVLAADLNLDGRPDVVYASADNDEIGWFRNTGNQRFSPELPLNTAADGARWVGVGDLNGDGNPDVICANRDADSIDWYPNNYWF